MKNQEIIAKAAVQIGLLTAAEAENEWRRYTTSYTAGMEIKGKL